MSFKRIFSTLLATLFFLVMNAQQPSGSYDAAWKKIDSLLNKTRLPNSALTEVEKIYAKAKAEKNNAQLIKALIYKSNIYELKEEDALLKNISLMEKEIGSVTDPARAVVQSITATMYWKYFQENRWKLYSRTETVGFKKDDIATWSVGDFHKKTTELFLASLAKEKLLQQTKLEPFDPIIEKGNARRLRPTLYDLLAHRALNYFESGESTITNPSVSFEIDNPAAFADAATFAATSFATSDTLSPLYVAFQLYQRLIKFHLTDANPEALIDVDILRLKFVRSNTILENAGELYENALKQITLKYADQPIATNAWYELAMYYFQEGSNYSPLQNPVNRYELLKAKEICERVVAQQPGQKDTTAGWAGCYNLLQEILKPELSMETEKVNLPGLPFRTLINWRNFTQLHFRLVKINRKMVDELNSEGQYSDAYWKKILSLPAYKTFTRELPDTRDHQLHSAEIAIDSLSIGQYALIASVDKNFGLENNPLNVQFFHISNIAWIEKDRDFYVLNRTTGQPLVRASVQVWYQYYDASTRKYALRMGENIMTDQAGHFSISAPRTENGRNQYLLEVRANNDFLFLNDLLYNYPESRTTQKKDRYTFLFTDRSLYRPGQMVYVKGIMINRTPDRSKSTIAPNVSTKLHLRDANGQVVSTVSVTSNEFGSYSATFNLPRGVLNGQFTIYEEGNKGSTTIKVEEYKRPRFLTEIAQPAGTYRLNDTIKVTGTAKAYAGNSIDGAKVKYRVTRQVIFPMWHMSGYSSMIWPPRGISDVEIAHGETTTDAAGNFTISFPAIPDKTVDKKDQPTFYFQVHADVTDNAGETRSASTSVSVAYQALKLNMELPESLHKDSLKSVSLSSTNFAGAFEKATVNLTIHKLLPPNRVLRERLWKQPDTFTMSRDEYYRLFPNDIYFDEDDPATWPRGEKVVDITDTTSSDSKFNIRNPKLATGWYVVEAITKDKYGEEVKAIRYLQLFDEKIAGPLVNATIDPKQTIVDAGEKAAYTVRTNADSAYVIHIVERKNNKEERNLILLNNSRSFEIPVTEDDRGGMDVSIVFVKNNRLYIQSQYFAIPYSNKELKISYATYRDKTLPGSQEKWSVTVSGYKGAKVAAEMLTAMYDASLDQYYEHEWSTPSLWDYFYKRSSWDGGYNFNSVMSLIKYTARPAIDFSLEYDKLIIDGDYLYLLNPRNYRRNFLAVASHTEITFNRVADHDGAVDVAAKKQLEAMPGVAMDASLSEKVPPPSAPDSVAAPPGEVPVQIRKNFNETAFFFPDLKTDADGNITFSFTMPEAVTEWKWMSMAHTKDLSFGYAEKKIVTQKELMVQANAPRFLREGDRMDFSAKIVNITDRELTGQVELLLIDPATGTSVDGWFQNIFPNQFFAVPANQSVPVSFTIEIPYKYNHPVTYKIVARAGDISDGEEAILPVISNRMLVTESMPLPLRGKSTQSFKLDKLLKSGESETLAHQGITVEYTSNPAWYAVQALPYLMEYPYECAEQIFNRYYANALATTIANSSPRIREIFERWKTVDTAALLSNLEKNQELKMILLEETPWVLQVKNESEQKKNIALLFDMVRMSNELKSSMVKLREMQLSNGGFPWFKGGNDDIFITQYILTGIGHLKKLGALPTDDNTINQIINTALPYLDKRIKERYDELLRINKGKESEKGGISHYEIQYLYMRSFFTEKDIPAASQKAYAYYRKQAQQHWQKQGRYLQAMIALAMHRTNAPNTAKAVMTSLKQHAVFKEEMGMYWSLPSGYFWYQAPVETQALMIEAFSEITSDSKAVSDMKTWLLKQKQTQNWRTTKATADAVYALLLQGKDWLSETPEVTIRLGNTTIRSSDQDAEAGTGYFKSTIEGKFVRPEMGNVEVFVKTKDAKEAQPSWGAVYWQYFEELDKITSAATPLKLSKKLFVEKNTDRGPVLEPINDGDALKVGDNVKVRIELRVDRDMEYVHMKDMRAASLEPVNVLSGYKWQGGLGYYESTKDASTNFFFSYLPKGTYVFEYALFVTHTGTFSNGITSIQCMYAPEFASHSEGVKIRVE